jgi:hypothetical protein
MRWDEINYSTGEWSRLHFEPSSSIEVQLSPIALTIVTRRARQYRHAYHRSEWVFYEHWTPKGILNLKKHWNQLMMETGLGIPYSEWLALEVDWRDIEILPTLARWLELGDQNATAIRIMEAVENASSLRGLTVRALEEAGIIYASDANLNDDEWVDEKAAAALAGLSLSWFRQLRTDKKGPPYRTTWSYGYEYRRSTIKAWSQHRRKRN